MWWEILPISEWLLNIENMDEIQLFDHLPTNNIISSIKLFNEPHVVCPQLLLKGFQDKCGIRLKVFRRGLGKGRKRVPQSSHFYASTADWFVKSEMRTNDHLLRLRRSWNSSPSTTADAQQRYGEPPASAAVQWVSTPDTALRPPPGSYKASSLARPSLPGLPIFHVYGETLRAEDEVACRRHDHRGLVDFPRLPQWLLRRREEEGSQSNR